MDGFCTKPEAFAFDFTPSAFLPSTKDGFHVKLEAYAIIGDDVSAASETDGFHVKPKTLKKLTDAINKMTADVQKIKELDNRTHELSYKIEKLQNELTVKLAHMHWEER